MRHVYQDQTIGGADILNSLADVNIGNPEDGQMLVYDASTHRWRNVTQKSLNDLAEVTDLTDIIATGTTNATGATIPKGTYFYLNDDLCQAKADIASGATFTENTNYEEVTAGGLNALNSKITGLIKTVTLTKTPLSSDNKYIDTGLPYSYKIISIVPTDREGWAFVPVKYATIVPNTWLIQASTAGALSGTYHLSISYIE